MGEMVTVNNGYLKQPPRMVAEVDVETRLPKGKERGGGYSL